MAKTLKPRSTNELAHYLLATPCPHCGAGPQRLDDESKRPEAGVSRRVAVRCDQCAQEGTVTVATEADPADADSLCISPVDAPSALVDLHQWLALAYMYIDRAHRAESHAAHEIQLRAALCLHEALKFYQGDDEVPPADALFTEAGRQAFREHPESFARQRVLDLLVKLPPPPPWPGAAD